MAFFKDLGKKITEGVQDASEKASELVELNKLNLAISREKSAIGEAKQQIGEKIYARYTAGENIPEALASDLDIIAGHLKNIAVFEAKIREIKGQGSATTVEAPITNTPSPPAGEPAAAAGQFCANCGAKLAEGTTFCGECGQKAQ